MRRKLARASFHGMLRYQAGLQNKQAFLFRLVDVANELFAMAATVAARAGPGRRQQRPEAAEAGELADLFCRIAPAPRAGGSSTRCGTTTTSRATAPRWTSWTDRHEWLEKGILGLGTLEAPRGRAVAEAEPKKVAVGVS